VIYWFDDQREFRRFVEKAQGCSRGDFCGVYWNDPVDNKVAAYSIRRNKKIQRAEDVQLCLRKHRQHMRLV
jgi:hypothetical protein